MTTMLKHGPLVSAIIPTYNRASRVCEGVESVLKQTYSNVEIIVVDDGSTDDTQARLTQFGNRIHVVTQANAGPSAARNHGIAVSRGEIIAFLDSDDVWLPTKLERQVTLLERVGPTVPCCLCNIMMQWDTGDLASFEIAILHPSIDEGLWLNVDEVLANRFVLFNQGIAIRRSVLERTGGFDETLRLLEDHELSLRLSLEGPWAFIREPLVIWHETPGSLYQQSKQDRTRPVEFWIQILEKHMAKLKDRDQHGRIRKHLARGLRKARRELRAAKIAQQNYWGASSIGNSLRKIEEYRSILFRRSPLFPRMRVEPVHYQEAYRRK
jgi:glycosyltransferase involved in cell wall biosynthesis